MQTIPLHSEKEIRWQQILADSKITQQALLARLSLTGMAHEHLIQNLSTQAAQQQFPLRVPEPYLARMETGNPLDPLLLQVLPQATEMDIHPGYQTDPLEEASSNPVPGLIHKYKSRVLLVLSGGCAINCRYCFRRHFPYEENQLGRQQWQSILDYIAGDTEINEVIFSGGDPLVTTDKRLGTFIQSLGELPQLKRLRIHSRLPIVIPQRITKELIKILEESRLQTVMVVHANHANEIDHQVGEQLRSLHQHGVTVLNQSVLLKGINDAVEPLVALSEKLFSYNTLPYYLHQLDHVQGAAHFAISDTQARTIMAGLQAALPGYLVPKLVREEADKPSKTLIDLRLEG